jgi:1-acyl-sn-glycerol-3-phosphate acyltransferase
MNALFRRLVTVPLVVLATLLMTGTVLLWLPVSLLVAALVPAARSAPRVLAFITVYLWCETLGVLAAFWILLRHRGGRDSTRTCWLEANYELQAWWCRSLKGAAQRLFRLRFEVEGAAPPGGDGVIMLLRHCSIGDTLIPVVFHCEPTGQRLRFVLKQELLFDPCLDIVGNRLPNYFADRGSGDTAREVEGVTRLLDGLPRNQGVLIYPEGTRFTTAKRDAILRRLEQKGETAAVERARAWTRLLPPRPGGPLAANPGRDLVFCAHTGFEGSASFARLFNGSWVDTRVRIRFWRVPFAEIPVDPDAQRAFLYRQWDRMNAELEAFDTGG